MYKERFVFYAFLVCLLSMTIACTRTYVNDDTDDDNDGSDDDNYAAQEDPQDYVWDNSDIIYITLSGTTASCTSNNVSITGSKVSIIASGTYQISGSLSNGQIIVNSDDDNVVRLILNNVNITCSNSSPIYVKDAAKAVIVLPESTVNYLTDGTNYSFDDTEEMEPNAPLFSKAYLSFYGTGSLIVDGNYGDGIVGKDGLVIKSGKITVTSVDDGIRGKDYIVTWDGDLTITSGGDGLKSNNETDSSLGYITINDGSYNINSVCDGINAVTEVSIKYAEMNIVTGGGSSYSASTVSKKGIKGPSGIEITDGIFSINSADDALHSESGIKINKGTFTISTSDDGIHAENSIVINDGTISVTKSYEALECKSITVNGGYISLNATNDGINATAGTVSGGTEQNDGSLFAMTAGYLYVSCSNGDAIDSNGNVTISGGTIVSSGPATGVEEAVDVNGSFIMNGGFFIGTGSNSNMTKSMSASSNQFNLYINSRSQFQSGAIFRIQDPDGKDIVTLKPTRAFYTVLFSSSGLARSVTYSIYSGGTCTGTETNGLYSGGSYSGGTLKKTFTLSTSGTVTSVSF